MPKAESATLPVNKRPESTSVPRAELPDAAGGGGDAEAPEAASGRRQRRSPASADKKKPGRKKKAPEAQRAPKPLSAEELQFLGTLMADAAALGLPVEEYAEELRKQVDAYERMLDVVAFDG